MGSRAIARGCDSLGQFRIYGYFRYKPALTSALPHIHVITPFEEEKWNVVYNAYDFLVYIKKYERKRLEYNWCFIVFQCSRLYV